MSTNMLKKRLQAGKACVNAWLAILLARVDRARCHRPQAGPGSASPPTFLAG